MRPSGTRTDVLLASMPFGPLRQPSIGLSLIRAALPPAVRSQIVYFTLEFADLIGPKLYERISDGFPETTALLGEWLFAADVFGPDERPPERYFDEVLEQADGFARLGPAEKAELKADLLRIRAHVPGFVAACALRIAQIGPSVLGLTTTFQQNMGSIALARRVKELVPQTLVAIGGANCEGIMGAELVRQFDCLDVAVSGEGELAFPRIVASWLADRTVPADVDGIVTRAHAPGAPVLNAVTHEHLDQLPIPEYDDFLEQWAASETATGREPVLLYETSRGCWWGERNHCTFCGLNGGNIAYRSKSAQRALDELVALVERYRDRGVTMIAAVDNILDMKYFRDFIPALAGLKADFQLFYEVKANLKREQVKALRDAGITRLQPGIETLSTPISKLMKKGVRALQNVQLLKFCKEYGILAEWNILFGFPGEDSSEYTRVARLIPHLAHLRPPGGAHRIRLDRFSPNFDQADAMGIVDVEPFAAYEHIYRIPAAARANIAYFFEYGYREERDPDAYTRELTAMVESWKDEYAASDLLFIDEGERLRLIDTRPSARTPVAQLRGLARVLLLFCDQMRSIDEIKTHVAAALPGQVLAGDAIPQTLLGLQTAGYLLREDNLYLSLAIRHGTYALSRESLDRFKARVAALASPAAAREAVPA